MLRKENLRKQEQDLLQCLAIGVKSGRPVAIGVAWNGS